LASSGTARSEFRTSQLNASRRAPTGGCLSPKLRCRSTRTHTGPILGWADGQVVQFRATGTLADDLSLRDLRALVFYAQGRYRHLDAAPFGSGFAYIEALLATIRRRASSGAVGARDQNASAPPEDE
jgi:hypothetical protein